MNKLVRDSQIINLIGDSVRCIKDNVFIVTDGKGIADTVSETETEDQPCTLVQPVPTPLTTAVLGILKELFEAGLVVVGRPLRIEFDGQAVVVELRDCCAGAVGDVHLQTINKTSHVHAVFCTKSARGGDAA